MSSTRSNSPPVEQLESVINRFWETFPPVWNSIREHIRGIVTENFDISVEQFHVLRHIRQGVHSTSELAAVKHISRPAISQAVDALVSKGLISRSHTSADRRYVQLELTESGQNLLDAVFRQNRQWMMDRLSALNPEELAAIASALEQLRRVFDEG